MGVSFMIEGRMEFKIDRQLGAPSVVMQIVVVK